MVRAVAPDWRVREAALADDGYLSVYHLRVETPGGPRGAVLKADPDGGGHGVDLEPRLLGILGEHTAVPVPEVYGAVDARGDLPAPYFLMESMPGASVHRTEVGDLPATTLERVARDTGRYAAAVHGVDAVDAYGYLEPAGPPLAGDRPSGSTGDVAVADPVDDWRERIREDAEGVLSDLEATRFSDLADAVRPALFDALADLAGAFEPVLCHVDASIENLLFEPGGEVTAVLDWAFAVAAPADYDLYCLEHSLAGGHWALVPATPDVRDAVRPALVEGYREAAGSPEGVDPRAIDRYRANREAYALLAHLRSATLFEGWFRDRPATGEETEAAAGELRERIEDLAG